MGSDFPMSAHDHIQSAKEALEQSYDPSRRMDAAMLLATRAIAHAAIAAAIRLGR